MSETRTESILKRVPVILAVTAASYGLGSQERPTASSGRQGPGHPNGHHGQRRANRERAKG